MSIRPVDLQVTVQKSPDINRNMNNDSNRPEVAQHQFAEKFSKEIEHNEQTVISTNKTEGRNVDKDGKGNQESAGGRKKKRRSSRESAKKSVPQGSSMFDVSI